VRDAQAITAGNTNSAKAVPEFDLKEVNFPAKLFFILGKSGLCSSGTEARRQIQGGGVKLDGDRVSDVNLTFESPSELDGRVLQVGKNKSVRLIG
jgi:tyrosyl-tRNA synthetase